MAATKENRSLIQERRLYSQPKPHSPEQRLESQNKIVKSFIKVPNLENSEYHEVPLQILFVRLFVFYNFGAGRKN